MYMKIQPSFVKYKKDKVYNCPSKKRIFAFLHISSPSWKDRNQCGYLLTDSDYIKLFFYLIDVILQRSASPN